MTAELIVSDENSRRSWLDDTTYKLYYPFAQFLDGRMGSREVIKTLKAEGWILDRIDGSHHQYVHPVKPGTVTVPHPRKDFPIGTIKSIEKQSGVKLR